MPRKKWARCLSQGHHCDCLLGQYFTTVWSCFLSEEPCQRLHARQCSCTYRPNSKQFIFGSSITTMVATNVYWPYSHRTCGLLLKRRVFIRLTTESTVQDLEAIAKEEWSKMSMPSRVREVINNDEGRHAIKMRPFLKWSFSVRTT